MTPDAGPSSASTYSLSVHVVNETGSAAGAILRIELLADCTSHVDETTSDSRGAARFLVTHEGQYCVRVAGPGIATTVSDAFMLDRNEHFHTETVRVNPAASNAPGTASVSEYSVPSDAKREFEKGMKGLQSNDLDGARKHFQSAIRLYPNYDLAYYNVGVILQRSGDAKGARDAYTKAVGINPHNAGATRALAYLLERDADWSDSERLLKLSLAVEPDDATSLSMMCIAQVELGKLDDGIAAGTRAEQSKHSPYAILHYELGRAYELKSQQELAISEYQEFLKEDPTGNLAEVASRRLDVLRAGPKH